jgi:hypothetical protein
MQNAAEHVGPWSFLPWQATCFPQKKIKMEKPHGGIGIKPIFEAKCLHN